MMTPSQSPVVAGPSRRQKKLRSDDKDIPSDESDTGDRLTPTTRRVRKRKHIPVPRVLNLGSKKPKSEAVASPVRRHEHRGSIQKSETMSGAYDSSQPIKGVEALSDNSFSKTNANPDRITPIPNSTHGISGASHSRYNTVGKHAKKLEQECTESRRNSGVLEEQSKLNEDWKMKWVVYSVWNPTWDFILKCENEDARIESEELKNLVLRAVHYVMPVPDLYELLENFKLISVEGLEKCPDGSVSNVKGSCYQSVSTSSTVNIANEAFRPHPQVVGKLLSLLISKGDLILVCDWTAGKKNGKHVHNCIIHVTSKDYAKHNALSKILNPGLHTVPQVIYAESHDVSHQEFGSYRVIKCCSYSSTLKSIPENPNPIRATTSSFAISIPAKLNNQRNEQQSSRNSSRFLQKASEIQASPDNDVVLLQEDVEVIDLRSDSESSEENYIESVGSNSEDSNSGNERSLLNQPRTFNLEYFLNDGLFVPGTMRPKVRKSDNRSSYTYHKLAELTAMLSAAVEEDYRVGRIPNMMVNQQCHTYGVVVDVINEQRHPNAYFVRISDETLQSVKLRIHAAKSDETIGPKIEVGNIIRIHRATVQMEWDSGLEDNSMVLSTSPHHNYVLFVQSSKTYQFFYHTSAKSISLDEFDKNRVGELQFFKINRIFQQTDNQNVPVLTENEQHNEPISSGTCRNVDRSELEYNCIPIPSSPSDGINTPDIMSVPPSVIEASENEEMMVENENTPSHTPRIQVDHLLSASLSDDSFHSAISFIAPSLPIIVDQPSQNENENLTSVQLNCIKFKDLQKTEEPVNLLCQIITLGFTTERNMWHLFIKDLEHTTPSAEFRQSTDFMLHDMDCLVLNITNANKLVERNILRDLYGDQGTGELYTIGNVKIKGENPPYKLEVDGSTCDIKRRPQYLTQFLRLEESFSSRTNITKASGQSVSENTAGGNGNLPANIKSIEIAVPSNVDGKAYRDEEQGRSLQFSENEHGQHNENANCASTSGSTYFTAEIASSPNLGQQAIAQNSSNLEEWTGRRKGKRKPREHYQTEDSFDC